MTFDSVGRATSGTITMLVDSVLADGLWESTSPIPREQGFVIGGRRQEVIQHVSHIHPHVEVVAQGTADECQERPT